MIDWNRLILDPVMRELGGLLREQYGVWVGVLDPFGGSYRLAEEAGEACALERLVPQDLLHSQDAGGFGVMSFDLELSPDLIGGRPVTDAQIYITGWMPSEEAYDSLTKIRDSLTAGVLATTSPEAGEELLGSIPRLDRRARAVMQRVGQRLAARAQGLLTPADCGDSGDCAGAQASSVRVPGTNFYGMIGQSRPVLHLFETIAMVAASNSTILIQGENGTGKELIARALHAESPRCHKPFVALNCAAVAGDLIASELFGHKRGAFSGAHRDRTGLLEEANGGTLFLDEIGDMELHLQAKLLRFLQEGTFLQVGDNVERRVDVRVLCATNQDLEAMVRAGEFRKDLFFRINVINLVSPPLRQRRDDIPVLIGHFLASAARRHQRPLKTLSEDCMARLCAHDWPGNVRELENEIERLVILSGADEVIEAGLISDRIVPGDPALNVESFDGMTMPEAVERLERAMILETLQKTGWNKSEAARQLGVSRRNLIRKVSHFELE